MRAECSKWAKKGVDIRYEERNSRVGYKAGALREGMKHRYVRRCEFVAIFDADFQPDTDFLKQVVPFLVYNSEISLVQARWKFGMYACMYVDVHLWHLTQGPLVNANRCLLTRMQEMSLNYHFTVEQEGGSAAFGFFGFNGCGPIIKENSFCEQSTSLSYCYRHGWRMANQSLERLRRMEHENDGRGHGFGRPRMSERLEISIPGRR